MSKRALKTYLSKLPKKALEEQIVELYEKFPTVKTYYDFFRSMLNSFNEVIHFTSVHGVLPEFKERILKIYTVTQKQKWLFEDEFSKALDILD